MTPRVVIIGGGFAGVGAVQKLKDADADVVLIDKHDYHTFQPLLYQLATGLLETSAVGHSLRDLVQDQDNATVHKTSVTAVDLAAREVQLAEMEPLVYDYLVLGLGAEVNFFGTKGAAEHAFPMYTLADAVRLKDHVLGRWEAADKDPSLIDDGALNVVVVGGGPTGVESAGALAELYRSIFAKDYPAVPQEKARVVLVEAGPELFSMFKPDIRAYTVEALEKRTVDVVTGEAVESVSPTRVTLKSGTGIDAHTLVWGAGLQGNQLVQSLGLDLERGNRIGVGPELTVPDHPEVYAVGDIAAIRDAKTDQVLPQLGSVALQSGEHAGETIARRLAGKKTKPFEYRDKGTMAMIGRGAAVVQMLGGRTMKGKKAHGGLGRRAPCAPADERGPREGGGRLGRIGVHAPAHRPDHGRNREGGVMADHDRRVLRRPRRARARAAAREGDGHVALRPQETEERSIAGSSSSTKGDHRRVAQERAGRRASYSADKALFDRIASGQANALAAHAPRGDGRRRRRPAARGVPAAPSAARRAARRRPPTKSAARRTAMSNGLVQILDGNTFVVSNANGDIEASLTDPTGLFSFDTRFLSQWVLTVNGQRLNPLSVDDLQYFETRFFLVPGPGPCTSTRSSR